MSRVFEALQRAGVRDVSAPAIDIEPVAHEAHDTAPTFGAHSVGHVASVRCPACGAPHPALQRYSVRQVLRLLRLPIYRCAVCHHRFRHRACEPIQSVPQGWGSTFLAPADGRSVQELMRDIGRQEAGHHDHRLVDRLNGPDRIVELDRADRSLSAFHKSGPRT
jgi:hypothetical protein